MLSNEHEFSVSVSSVYIYNEKVFDLLRPGIEMQIVTQEKNYYINDVTQTFVTSAEEAFADGPEPGPGWAATALHPCRW